tara:strand:- start:106 stop:282 length:177 start_codon:yes stop_codon:yes gene_type:complete
VGALFQELAGDVRHPDNMSRKEKLQMIASFECYREASSWWLRHAPRISKKAFNEARGF